MRALIIRHCAFGDAIHASHLPRLLSDQGYTVDIDTNFKGSQVFAYNPFVNKMWREELSVYPSWIYQKYFDSVSEGYDYVVDLGGTIESGLLAMEHENIYYMSNNVRRERWSQVNYYDAMTSAAGFPELTGQYRGEMFFTEGEEAVVSRWVDKFRDKFTVLINLSGTGPHKRFVQADQVIYRLLEDEDTIVILSGSPEFKDYPIKHDRVINVSGRFPFRQSALVTKFMDCVIGCESGLMCASAMWETPTIQLMTATSILAHNKYNKNDFSLQSPCYCSPCFKGPYDYIGCPSKDGNPLCVYFEVDRIMNQVEKVKEFKHVTV